MKQKKSIFMLMVLTMSILSQFITTIGTIQAFAEGQGQSILDKPSAHLLPKDKEGNRTILTDVEMKLTNKKGEVEEISESNPLKIGDVFEIHYTFAIPDQLGKEVESGDYFEFELPKSEHISLTKDQEGDLVDPDNGAIYGKYYSSKEGHVTMVFNEQVQTHDDVDGHLAFKVEFVEKSITIPGGYEIEVPYVSNSESGFIYVVGKINTYIQKEYLRNDGFTYYWKILLNPTYEEMENIKLTETTRELGGGNAVAESINIDKMVKADVDLSGNITEREEVNVKNKTFDSNGNIDLGFDSINQPHVMYISTPFPFGIKNNVENNILLESYVKGKQIMLNADAVSNAGSQGVMDKKVLSYDKESQIVEWQITYNPNSFYIQEKDAHFKDEITNGTLTEDPMNVNPNLSHDVDVASNRESFEFSFKEDVTKPVVIKYKTKVKDPKVGSIRNKVISGEQVVDVPQEVEDNGNGEGDGQSSITKSKPRPSLDGALWTLDINPEKQKLDKWWVTDKLNQGTIRKTTLKVMNETTKKQLAPGRDFELEWFDETSTTATGFTITYNEPTSDRFSVTYTSDYERNTSQSNQANYHYVVNGNEKEDEDRQTYDPPQVGEIGLSKSGKYIPDSREIEWTVQVNERANVPISKDNLLRDPIPTDQTYVNGSAKVEYRDGTVWNALSSATVDYSDSKKQLTVTNLKQTSNAQRVVFRTKLVNDLDVLTKEVRNTAYYSDDFTEEKSATASLTIDNANNYLLKKRGKQNANDINKVDWEVDINPHGYRLNNVVIYDENWENQVVIRETIEIKDPATGTKLVEGKDYELDYTERYFKITMKDEVDKKLLLTYQGRLLFPYGTPLGSDQTAKNSVRITADRVIKTDKPIDITIPVKVSDSSGTIQGKLRDFTVKKVSEDDNKEVLSGAEFTLYRGTSKDPNKVVDRVTTNNQGIANFGKLTKGDYLLVETKAPKGYEISNEMKNGRIVKVVDDNTTPIEEVVANPKEGQAVKTIDIPIEKQWKNVPSGIETPEVTVRLYANNEPVQGETLTLNKNNNYKGTFTDLPEEKNGKKINYSVKEDNIPNYDTSIDEYVITNTYHNKETTSLSGKKEWNDDGDKAKKRPERVKIELLQDNNHYEYDYVYEEDNWKFEFSELPKINNKTGQEYKYTVKEVEVPDGYETSVNGTTITNTYKEAATTSLSGRKIWKDNEDAARDRPESIIVELYQDKVYLTETKVSSNTNWEYKFEDLPKVNESTGDDYKYTVKEKNTPDGYESKVDGNNIINTYTKIELISVSGKKEWKDDGNLAGKRPKSVEVKLLQNDKFLTKTEATAANDWKYTFTELPKRDTNGNLYRYTVEEVNVPEGYTSKVDGTLITNTYTEKPVETTVVEGEKIWVDNGNKESTRPAYITVQLMRSDNSIKPYQTKTVTAGSDNRWRYKFSDLPKYDENNREYKYSVKEVPVKDYETENTGKYDLTNTLIKPKTMDINGKKIWRDEENVDGKRPNSVTVELLQNGTPYKKTEAKGDSWEYNFKEVPIYDSKDQPYDYTVKEVNVPDGYTSTVSGTTITNSYKPVPKETIIIEGNKNWDDHSNKYNTRPENVTINLFRNDNPNKPYESQVVSPIGNYNWSYKFVDLPKYETANKEYEYWIEEAVVPNYIGGKHLQYSLLNTLNLKGKTKVTGEKRWDDEEDKDSIRPDKVIVRLQANGVEVPNQVREVSAKTNWKFSFDDLDMYDSRSQLIKYTVKEDKVDGYTDYHSVDKDDPYHIIVRNKHTVKPIEKISISGEKKWEDQQNAFGKRPESITVDLYQDDIKIDFQEVSKATNWKYEFKELNKFKGNSKEEHVYTVKENTVPKGYKESVNEYDITNTYLNDEVTQVTGQKVWDDYDNKFNTRPKAITVKLYQGNTWLQDQEVSEKTDWKYSFTDLPVYDDKGNKFIYRVEEDNVPNGYTSTISDNKITNVYRNTEKTEITGEKIWNDYDNQFKTRPSEIKVELYNGTKIVETKTVKPDKSGDWKYSFTNLPKYDESGNEIKYSVKEQPVDQYTTSVKGNDIYNTYVNTEKTEISVIKKWEDKDNLLNIRPEKIKVNLLKNGTQLSSTELSESNNWQHTFDGLDKYDNNGKAYVYTVVEEGISTYITTHNTKNDLVTINNKLNEDEALTSLSGMKIWDDYENQFKLRPNFVTITLLQDGEVMLDDKGEIMSQQVSEESNWEYAFEKLPKINGTTNKNYVYTVKEEAVGNGYNEPVYDGSNIINKYRNNEKITINGYKLWDDYNDKFETRPESFKVHLLQDNDVIETKEVKKSEGYSFEFTELPKYDENGVIYKYSVTEEVPAPYTVSKEVTEENNTILVTLTNTYRNTETISIEGEKTWDDYENKFNTRPSDVTVQLVRNDGQVTNQVVTAETNWHYEFKELPKYDDKGNEYTYSVKEVIINNQHGYTSEVVGNDLINHYVNQEKINFSGEKVWDDYDNKFKTRPGSVTIYLYDGDTKIDETKTDAKHDWKYEFNKGYPVYDALGNKIEYSVREKKVSKYTTTIEDYTITNKYVNTEKTSLGVSKKWDDFEDQFNIRPTELKVTLHPTNQVVNLSEENNWEHEFKDLLVYDEMGEEINYWVEEEVVPGYTATHDDGATQFINRATELDAKTSISGTKIWNDEKNKLGTRPSSITVELYQNEQPMMGSDNQLITQEISVLDGWRYEFNELPKYDEFGNEFLYSVNELEVDHYETMVANDDIINSYINNEKVEVHGKKIWKDLENKLETRPESITVLLYQSGLKTPFKEQVLLPNENGDWEYSFTDLPKYDSKLNEYSYRVEEVEIPDYTLNVDGYDLTNTYKNNQKTEVSGEKIWMDLENKLSTRPDSITVELYQNGNDQPYQTQEVTPNAQGDWKYDFKELPKYDENYDLYEYTVKEVEVPHYESVIYEGSENTIYNHYVNDDKTNVKIIKKWEDQGNKLNTRPESIRVNLYRNNGRLPYKTQTILSDSNGNWSYEFKDLPKYDNNLELYEYTAKEMKVSDYTATIIDDPVSNVSTITNKYDNPETIEVNGFKAWLDHDNKLGSRPESIKVDLYRSDSSDVYQTQEVTPNEKGYWYYSFKELPKYDDELNLYTYTVQEQPVAHYDSAVSDTNIINSYRNDETVNLSGEKIWKDLENKLNTRPESIQVELYQGDKLLETKDVVEGKDGKWLYEFKDLPKYNANLEEYTYSIREPKVPGYKTEIEGTTITNYYQNDEKVTVPVKKIWKDQSDKLNTRPSMIKVDLYQNGGKKPYKTEVLLPSGTDEWSYEFKDLPKYDDKLVPYEYTVKEQKVPGYETETKGNTITNTYINKKTISLKGEKIWEDEGNKLNTRPDKIYIDLYQNNQEKPYATQEVIADSNRKWSYEFTDLPQYDEQLELFSYHVEEREVPKYDSEILGTTIKNTYRNDDKVEVTGEKKWSDLDNKLNKRPKSIRVELYQNEQTAPYSVKTVKADSNGNWKYSFKDLPKYDNALNEYTYTVKEQPVKNYATEIDGTTITNTYQNNETTSISGKKVWDDENNVLNSRPESIVVELHQNDSKDAMDKKEITADSEGNWQYDFVDLPKYDDELNEYTYTVTEKVVPHYETTIEGTTITNKYRNDEKVSIEGQKIWQDEDNKLNTRPKSIQVELYQNDGDQPLETQTVKADSDGNWSYKFENLAKYDDQLKAYDYTVKEKTVKNYDSKVEGTLIRNTYQNTSTISLTGEKTWDDFEDKLNKRPDSIFVELYQTTVDQPTPVEGQSPFKIQKVTADKKGHWTYEFTDLPEYDSHLDKYIYTVKEHSINNYTSQVTGMDIKNTYLNEETTEVTGEKIWKGDFDNKIESRPESIQVNLYQNDNKEVFKTQTVTPDEDGNWNYSFKKLPKYDDQLNEYKYSVTEESVPHYESKIKGTTITNTYQNTDLTKVEGNKQWNDEGDKLNKRPDSITVELYQNNGKKPFKTQQVTAGKDNDWAYEFTDLPKYDKDLNEYVYTVKEQPVEGYTTIIEGTTIINTFKNVETTKVKGEKKWEDFNDKLGVRPSVITVDLYQNDSKDAYRSQLVVPDKDGNWKYAFNDLPKYDEKLVAYSYSVKEQKVPHYDSAVSGTTITNTYRNDEKVSIDGKKVWKDEKNKLNSRPDSITVDLYQNEGEKPFKSQVVKAGKDNKWAYEFTDLPKYDESLTEYRYTVKEQEVHHYDSKVDGTTITNTYRNDDKTSLKGEKVWTDFDNKLNSRPEKIIVELYQNNQLEPFATQEVKADSANKWTYEFKDLPKYDTDLNEYDYTVKEQVVPHYTSNIEGTTITNTYQNNDLIEVKGKKVWEDVNNKLEIRPNTITVELYQNGRDKPFRTQEVKAGIDKQWRYSFKNLPKYDEELNEFTYTVKEQEVPHYETAISGTTITNTYRNDDLTQVNGEKIWQDNQDKLQARPKSITVELYQNNGQKPFKTQEVKADENNNWRYSFEDLPKYDKDLNEYSYTVKEQEVPHYTSDVSGTTITNTYRNDDVTKVAGKKVWDDLDNKLNVRPETITVDLYQNNGKTPFKSQTIKADKKGDWNYTFENLPKYDDNLDEYTYTVKEQKVSHYESSVVGTTITNTYRNDDITELSGKKIWDDQDNKLHLRPESITIHLYQNGGETPFKSQEVSGNEEGDWNYSFKDLPKYDENLNEYEYTVKEQFVPLYSSQIEGTTITNTFRNDHLIKLSGRKIWKDSGNKLEYRPQSIFVDVYQNEGSEPFKTQEVKMARDGSWSFTFEDLPKYDPKLNEYAYAIKEHGVPHYDSSIEGTTIVNTYRNDEVTEVEGEKLWKDFDNKLESRPDEITVELYQNGGAKPFDTQRIQANEDGKWYYSFKELPKYDDDLNEYTYTVKEKVVKHYDSSVEGTTITNTYRNDETTKVEGEKRWKDFDDKLKVRPNSITVELYQNDSKEVFKTQEVSADLDNKWYYSFENLPKYDAELNPYTYTVKEKTVANYDSEVAGTIITNTYRNEELTEISGQKLWEDNNNKANKRPDSIIVELYQNGGKEAFKSQTVQADASGNWDFSFGDLPKYDKELNEYEYTVKEIPVKGYTSKVNGTTITNTLVEEPVKPIDPTDPTNPVEPKTPGEGHLPKSGSSSFLPKTGEADTLLSSLIGIAIVSISSMGLFIRRRRS
ncbi:Cna B-type domain-containing protein [Vagococcus fluvialis]|uniref:Cna B-type domain-containing protein n=1 Tax=Vagococcus fluvialis TaxID=2738 RepID=UPI003B5A4F13